MHQIQARRPTWIQSISSAICLIYPRNNKDRIPLWFGYIVVWVKFPVNLGEKKKDASTAKHCLGVFRISLQDQLSK